MTLQWLGDPQARVDTMPTSRVAELSQQLDAAADIVLAQGAEIGELKRLRRELIDSNTERYNTIEMLTVQRDAARREARRYADAYFRARRKMFRLAREVRNMTGVHEQEGYMDTGELAEWLADLIPYLELEEEVQGTC